VKPVQTEDFEWACKPNSVTRLRGLAIIHLGRRLLGASSGLPEETDEQPAMACAINLLLGLAPDGVCLAGPVAWAAGGLLHHRFTLTAQGLALGGDLLSVALCRRVTPPGRYPASRSMEFGLSS